MKPFAKRLLALASAAAIVFTTIPAVRSANAELVPAIPDEQWSAPAARAMEELVPAMIRNAPDSVPLTRQNLCSMAMDSYRSLTGLAEEDMEQPVRVFTDTDDTDVLLACQMNLIQGKTPGIFAPGGIVSRQEFWTAAANLLELVGYPCPDDIDVDLSVYEDSDEISADAVQTVQILLSIEAITAEAGSTLDPNGTITTGEAEEILQQIAVRFTGWQEEIARSQRYLGEDVAEFALEYVGCRYVRGGQGPNKFDCSGFVYYVYKNFSYNLEPGARNQWSLLGECLSKSDLLPGDLVFFSKNSKASGIFHVGIYIGNDQFVHAANPRKGLIVTDMDDDWYARRYFGAKRAIQ